MISLCSLCNSRFEKDFPPGSCHICGGKLEALPALLKKAESCIRGEWNTFSLSTTIPKSMLLGEEDAWDYSYGESLKSMLNAFFSRSLQESTGKAYSPLNSDGRVSINLDSMEAEGRNEPLFIFGRYKKLVRGICQSRWPCLKCGGSGCARCGGKGKMYDESVEELIGDAVVSHTGGTYTLHASGREDIDVLNFAGRPFVLEVKNPDSVFPDFSALESEINSPGKVEVSGLRRAAPGSVKLVSDSHFPKTYRAWVGSVSPLTKEDAQKLLSFDFVLAQRTPERVSHRRADKVRKRRARVISASLEDTGNGAGAQSKAIIADIHADAGTYIKELIHGDKGRTSPSFSSFLGKECSCERLDVTRIEDAFLDLVLRE